MKFTIKKTFSLLLAAMFILLSAASLGACGNKTIGGNDLKGLEKVRLEHVYLTKYMDLNLPEGSNVQSVYTAGDDVYLYVYRNWQETDENGNPVYNYANSLYILDENGGAVLLDILPETGNSQKENNTYEYTNVSSIAPAPDKTLWYTLSKQFEDLSDPENYVFEFSLELVHVAADGTELAKIPLNSLAEEEGENVYINQIIPMEDGRIAATGNNKVYILKQDGTLDYQVRIDENGWLGEICVNSAGDVFGYLSTYNPTTYENKSVLVRLDAAGREFTEIGSFPSFNYYRILGAENNAIIMYDSNAVYTYDTSSGAITERLNWLNSDINANRVSTVVPISQGRFFITEYSRNYENIKCAVLTRASDSDVIEKYIIKLASVYLNDRLRDAIINYNKGNAEFRIQYVDYSQYNTDKNPSGGTEKLNMDIISGSIPDIISLLGLNGDIYSSKGLLFDLGAFMDADEAFDRSLYLENIFSATVKNQKMYSVIPEFYIYSAAGKTENVGTDNTFTISDLMALMQKYPEAAVFSQMTRSDLLNNFGRTTLGQYIDTETGLCSFNSADFINLLGIMKQLPEEIDWDAIYADETFWERYESQYREDRTLLTMCSLSSFNEVRYLTEQFGGDFTFTGFPSHSGIGSSIVPAEEIAVSSKTKLKDACWEFVKYLLSEQYQSEITYNFPVKVSCLEALEEKAMTEGDYPIIYRDAVYSSSSSQGGIIIKAETAAPEKGEDGVSAESEKTEDAETGKEPEKDVSTGDIEVPIRPIEPPYYNQPPLTQEQIDKAVQLIRSVTRVSRDYTKIIAIIEEDAPAFFNGQKTAEAVVTIIQSRVQLYINENY